MDPIQEELAARPRWIMDGDLGQYDVLGPRLVAADTVLVLDFSLVRCIWRAAPRGTYKYIRDPRESHGVCVSGVSQPQRRHRVWCHS